MNAWNTANFQRCRKSKYDCARVQALLGTSFRVFLCDAARTGVASQPYRENLKLVPRSGALQGIPKQLLIATSKVFIAVECQKVVQL